jgi:hypothetical protein
MWYVQGQQRGRVAEDRHRPWKPLRWVRQRRRVVKNRGKTCTGNRVLIPGAVVSRYGPVSPVLSHGANLVIST